MTKIQVLATASPIIAFLFMVVIALFERRLDKSPVQNEASLAEIWARGREALLMASILSNRSLESSLDQIPATKEELDRALDRLAKMLASERKRERAFRE